ncbi:interleukin 3 [Rattus norvegicus]|uniref:Interleukin-3 n=1 Tax=Rattus norvegicus TaxID=10116 RepID=A6HEH2_RAT|nr:interleukin-3 isoform X1 [Rattus norvegicus]EDM04427.1 interleukin 3 [Rattus norvegicus]|eukprot:XP_006246288.1 PREDICTED: interleukin-3 isoform X1 [Rattus norvegicus]
MVLASSTTSILCMLLPLLMLFHQGLQFSGSAHRLLRTLDCRTIALEILVKLPVSGLNNSDDKANLRNSTLRRVNLDEFLKSQEEFDSQDTMDIKSKLQKLKCCIPAAASDSVLPGVYNKDLDDFKKKLRFYVIHLKDLQPVSVSRPPQPTSSSDNFRPMTVEC